MKNYIQAYISHTQDDWVDHLPLVKFSANNYVNESTEIIQFFADNGFHPRTGIKPPQTFRNVNQKAELLSADKIVASQQERVLFLQDQLVWAQKKQAHWANQNRQPHSRYKVRDMVYVDAKHFASEKSSKSLSMKNAGLWKILWSIANKAYKLEIPQQMKETGLTSVFYPWKMHFAPTNLLSGQVLEPGSPIQIRDNCNQPKLTIIIAAIEDYIQKQ